MSQDGADVQSKPAQSWSAFVHSIVDDCLSTIVHEVAVDIHRNEKLLRMQSAATQVSMLATDQKLVSPATETPTKPSQSAGDLGGKRRVETEAAVWDGGIITLKGNPLLTTKQILCPQCRLPRLLYPLSGAGSRAPDDLNIEYCTKHPYVQRPGHDIFGQPFPSMVPAKGKKEKDLLKQQRADKDSTPASQNSGAADEELQSSIAKLAPQGKGSDYIPWNSCPKCKRSLLITRFAQHLEKCMGISGRTASRNAMAKMGGQNGSIGSTPMGSRPGTPGPGGSQGDAASSTANGRKREREDDDDADELDDMPLKKMKRRPYIKKADRDRLVAESQGSQGGGVSAPSSQNGDKEAKDKPGERDSIKLKIRPPSGGTPSKDKDGQAKKPVKPGGHDAGEDTPSKKLKKAATDSSGSP